MSPKLLYLKMSYCNYNKNYCNHKNNITVILKWVTVVIKKLIIHYQILTNFDKIKRPMILLNLLLNFVDPDRHVFPIKINVQLMNILLNQFHLL